MALTPMQLQYQEFKAKYPDAIVLFRLGDFYETFNEDAITCSKVLGLTLTARGKDERRQPMAGVPYHAIQNYLRKLIDNGYKVVLIEQKGEAVPGKLVERRVLDIISPSVVVEESLTNGDLGNYMAVVAKVPGAIGNYYCCLVDVGSQSCLFYKDLTNIGAIQELLLKYSAKELAADEETNTRLRASGLLGNLSSLKIVRTVPNVDFNLDVANSELTTAFGLNSFKRWGLASSDFAIALLNATRRYILENYQKELPLFNLQIVNANEQILIPHNVYKALEIFSDGNGNVQNSLFNFFKKTATRQGLRQLQDWFINLPCKVEDVEERHEVIAWFLEDKQRSEAVLSALSGVTDIERQLTKLKYGRLRPQDTIALGQSIASLMQLQAALNVQNAPAVIQELLSFEFGELETLAKTIVAAINPESNDLSVPGFINPTYTSELEQLVLEATQGTKFLREMEAKEISTTGIPTLKVRYNSVFGYYIEVSAAQSSKVPAHYVRKQTLVNAERYITQELKEWEERHLKIQDIRLALEQKLYKEICAQVTAQENSLQQLSLLAAKLDVLNAFSVVAKENGFVAPQFSRGDSVKITAVSHPILAAKLKEKYVPNSVEFNSKSKVHILTGPNMAGKSTYIRSIAICQFMAQIGSFVPAEKAELRFVDGIFTRVGAADNLSANESTFMVEMLEMAYILQHATANSLIVLDEVGRGTSTYDGVALAWALLEHIASVTGAFCLFATHYHEITDLAGKLDNVKNYYVEVIAKEKLYFTHLVKPGFVKKSFGVQVAQMAGIAPEIIERAEAIQHTLQSENDMQKVSKSGKEVIKIPTEQGKEKQKSINQLSLIK